MRIVAKSLQMKWIIVPLGIQTIAGITLTFRSVSLSTWEPNEGIQNRSDWLSTVTGVVFLASAGLGWYVYAQNMVSCWGLTGLRLLKTCVDGIALVLLYFVFFRAKPDALIEPSEEQ